MTAIQAYNSVTIEAYFVAFLSVWLQPPLLHSEGVTLSPKSVYVCVCQIMTKQLPRARTMHSKSVC